jgi:hypothetical protein
MHRVLHAFGLAACSLYGTVAVADEYSWEVSGAISQTELDVLVDSEKPLITATRYFGRVDDGLGPLALAVFFDPESRVAVTATREKSTSHPIGPGSEEVPDSRTDTDAYTLSGRHVFPRSKWYAGGRYTKRDPDSPPLTIDVTTDSDAYGLLVGKYLGTNTTLELRLDRAETRTETPSIFCVIGSQFCGPGGETTTEQETDDAVLEAMHVRRFRDLTYALSGRIAATSGQFVLQSSELTIPAPVIPFFGPAFQPAGVVALPPTSVTIPARTLQFDVPRTRSYSAAAELFPTTRLGVRVGYTRFDDDTSADEAYDLGVGWFFHRKVGVELAYGRQRADSGATFDEIETAAINVRGRF